MKNDFIDMLTNLTSDPDQTLDLSNPEDNKKFKELVSEIKDNEVFKSLLDVFGIGDTLDDLENLADTVLQKSNSQNESKDESKSADKPVVETLSSNTLPVNVGLQIHKLVTEYVDTMIKPYISKSVSQDDINNSYVALYEFAAWLYNK